MNSRRPWHHGGNLRHWARLVGCAPHEILDFSANMNPLGPPDWLRPTIDAHVDQVVHYPDPHCEALTQAAAQRFGLGPASLVWGNGASQLLFLLPQLLRGKRALLPTPCYSDYAKALAAAGYETCPFPLPESQGFTLDLASLDEPLREKDLVILARPNNPTGLVPERGALERLITKHPRVIFVVDEAFMDFLEDEQSLIRSNHPNLVVIRSMTKFFCIPGLRLGFAVAPPPLAQQLRALVPPWSVNALAQAVGAKGLEDRDYATRSRAYTRQAREALVAELTAFPQVVLYPGEANYLLVRLREGSAANLAKRLLRHRIAIRTFNGLYLDDRFFRIAVRSQEENQRLVDSLRSIWQPKAKRRASRRKTPAVMFQGSGSNVGKSIMATAMCRVLLQDGFQVAPFKAQNMSLNAFVTRDGKEMARAQVLQAQACRLEPHWHMNPVLLKPSGAMQSQVIFCGEPLGHREYGEYRKDFPAIRDRVRQVYDQWAAQHEVMVLEGAGSPGEINLKDRDLVNMSMAAWAQAAVVLVGDIDRGGVFASFMGTMTVLAQWERALVAGYLINRFRGEVSLLADALAYLKRYTGRDTFGVMPYLQELGLPEEDSVGFRQNAAFSRSPRAHQLDIAILDLPHIANFTDFDPFTVEPEVSLRRVSSTAELGNPHVIILPGSKNTAGDLHFLIQSGLAARVKEHTQKGNCEILGLCGGLQMLGRDILDPDGVESAKPGVKGLALLPLTTRWHPAKRTRQVTATHLPSGLPVRGYEIHHGQSDWQCSTPVIKDGDKIIGVAHGDLPIWGTYLHGIFENDRFRRWWIDGLRRKLGFQQADLPLRAYDLEPALDRLAEVFREKVDLEALYRTMGLS